MTDARDWTNPTRRRDAAAGLRRDIKKMSENEGSGVQMCHEQGKTAVYLSSDGSCIVEHEPNGTVRYLALQTVSDATAG